MTKTIPEMNTVEFSSAVDEAVVAIRKVSDEHGVNVALTALTIAALNTVIEYADGDMEEDNNDIRGTVVSLSQCFIPTLTNAMDMTEMDALQSLLVGLGE